MKTHSLLLLFLTVLITGCGKPSRSVSASDWKEGEIHATRNEHGSFSVFKIVKIDEDGVFHLRLYSNVFDVPPADVDASTLYIAGDDRREDEAMGMVHYPVPKGDFASWDTVYVKTVDVLDEELEAYRRWLADEERFF